MLSCICTTVVIYLTNTPTWPHVQISTVLGAEPTTSIGSFCYSLSSVFLLLSLETAKDTFAVVACICWLGLLSFPAVALFVIPHIVFTALCLGSFAAHMVLHSKNWQCWLVTSLFILQILIWLGVFSAQLATQAIPGLLFTIITSVLELSAVCALATWFPLHRWQKDEQQQQQQQQTQVSQVSPSP